MVHQYKLVYFNGRGRAEPSRLIFAYAGVNYTDQRIEQAEWPGMKSKTPFGQLPVLDIGNGKVLLTQSKAIARYLGNEFNLMPKDHIQAGRGDMLVDGYEDVQKQFVPWFQEKDPAKKKELWKKLEQEHMVPFLALYEKFLVDNGSTYFLGNSITWADLFLFDALYKSKQTSSHLFDGHPKLTEFINKIEKEPKIHAWLEKRPKTEF